MLPLPVKGSRAGVMTFVGTRLAFCQSEGCFLDNECPRPCGTWLGLFTW